MINLELSEGLKNMDQLTKGLAEGMLRPISRKYDIQEHDDIPELDQLKGLMGGGGGSKKDNPVKGTPAEGGDVMSSFLNADGGDAEIKNGGQMTAVVTVANIAWGCCGLMLALPGAGLGNAAIQSVASPEQKARFGQVYAGMAITEPSTGSDSSAVSTTAVLDGDEWILNGEKIFVTAGHRCNTVVVWATLDKAKGKAAIKSFVVPKGSPGMELVRLEKKMGIRASDTAAFTFTDCRIPKDNILGDPEVADTEEARKKAFGGVMQTFDNTRPMVAAMAIGVGQASIDMSKDLLGKEGIELDYSKRLYNCSAVEAELYRMEADIESARLLALKAGWMADNKMPNSTEASMSKAKAGRAGSHASLKAVELCQSLGFSIDNLLEKFARDSKILDIFEGTQQIQQLIVARNVLGLSSKELK